MKKYLIISCLIISAISLGGCSNTKTETSLLREVTKSGTLSTKSGDEYLLVTDDGIVNITSTKINLDNYLKKQISVSGMFSGSTLYVDKIE